MRLIALLLTLCLGCTSTPSAEIPGDAPAPETRKPGDTLGAHFQRELTPHLRDSYAADLPEILKRKVIRVGMLNNGASYFVYRGQEVGFQFELAELLARRLEVRLQVVIPENPAAMGALLADGHADVVALTPTTPLPGVNYTSPISEASQRLVQRAGHAPIDSEEALAGRTVTVRKSSAYYPSLLAMQKRVPTLKIAFAPEDAETEELIDGVAAGDIELTVANSVLLDLELTYRNDVQGSLAVGEDNPLVYATRASAPELTARLTRFAEEEVKKPEYAALNEKYFQNTKRMGEVRSEEAGVSGKISPYDEIVKKHAAEKEIDWRLILAQMYQESRFDPQAKSWAGARGLMQLMPATAQELGVKNITDPEENVRGGVEYMRWLINRFDASMPMRQRIRFALASYNAGFEHVKDARILAKKMGWSDEKWFGNVEKAMLLLEKRKYYRKARRGYVRGREPVAYVSRIQSKYDAYSRIMPDDGVVPGPAPKGSQTQAPQNPGSEPR